MMNAIQHAEPLASTPFVRAIEVWLPSPEGEKLIWASGVYSSNGEFEKKSRELTFGTGEGVPGKAWKTHLPVISKDLPQDDFLRGEAASRVGIDCAIAVPVMKDGTCQGVISFLCSSGDKLQGAFEVWSRNDREELGLSASYYANLQRFGAISQCVRLPRRAGLPGKTWSDREPKVVSRVGLSKSFMRAAGARADNLSTAFSWPLMRSALELDAVFMILSAAKSPIARVMEIWKPDSESGKLKLVDASYGPYVDLEPLSRKLELAKGEGLIGQVFAQGQPVVVQDLAAEPARGQKLIEYEFNWALGLPVFIGDDLSSILVMMH